MSEFGEGVPNNESSERRVQIPEQYDHKGRRFESPEADTKLGQIRERVLSERKNPTAVDLLDIIRCEVEDIDKQKQFVMDKDPMTAAKRELNSVRNTLLHVVAREHDQISMIDKTKVHTYIDRHKQRWEIKASAPNIDDAAKAEAEENQQIFANLDDTVFDQEVMKTYLDDGIQKLENAANGEEEKDTELEEIQMYDQFKPEARTAFTYLQTFRDKEITLGDFNEALNWLEDDISAEEREYIEKNPGWEDKKNAVSAANIIYTRKVNETGEEAVENDILYATVDASGTATASWNAPKRKHEGAKYYAFTLKKDAYDEGYKNYFGEHKYNVEAFDIWRNTVKRGQKALRKLQSGEQISLNEGLILSRFVDMMRDAVPDEQTEEAQQDVHTVNTLSKLVKKSVDQTVRAHTPAA